MPEDWQSGGFGLYVHWPFCEAKCPYCDFNSHVSRTIDHEAWRAAYTKELARVAAQTSGRVLNAIYFGGGTPSLMEPATVDAIISGACRFWRPANDLEITLEANPGSVESRKFRDFASAGVNRISLGVQALDDGDLKRLGRLHSADDARRAVSIAQGSVSRVSIDLIYARQDQTVEAWSKELQQAVALATEHLSLYQLTIEPGTAFGDRYRAGTLRGLPQEERAADLFEATEEICTSHGFRRYEVSNHAKENAHSRHNLIYWRYGDYAGIGPGAHGRFTLKGIKYATEAHRQPTAWLKAVENGSGDALRDTLSGTAQAEEYLMMGLRTSEGVDPERYARLSGKHINSEALRHLEGLGMVKQEKSYLSVTNQGLSLLNAVTRELLTAE